MAVANGSWLVRYFLREWLSSKSDWTICTSQEYVWINHHQAIWGEQFKVCHDSVAVDWPGKHETCKRIHEALRTSFADVEPRVVFKTTKAFSVNTRMFFPHLRKVQLFMNLRAAVGAHMWRRQTSVCPNESSSIFHNNCCRGQPRRKLKVRQTSRIQRTRNIWSKTRKGAIQPCQASFASSVALPKVKLTLTFSRPFSFE